MPQALRSTPRLPTALWGEQPAHEENSMLKEQIKTLATDALSQLKLEIRDATTATDPPLPFPV